MQHIFMSWCVIFMGQPKVSGLSLPISWASWFVTRIGLLPNLSDGVCSGSNKNPKNNKRVVYLWVPYWLKFRVWSVSSSNFGEGAFSSWGEVFPYVQNEETRPNALLHSSSHDWFTLVTPSQCNNKGDCRSHDGRKVTDGATNEKDKLFCDHCHRSWHTRLVGSFMVNLLGRGGRSDSVLGLGLITLW